MTSGTGACSVTFNQKDVNGNVTSVTQDVCDNIVPVDNKDNNKAQHMTTFTLGLGLNGTLTYRKDYESAPSGDYFDIKQGTKIWPEPVADTLTAVDDLWHAAVNGRGTYYSANNAAEMPGATMPSRTLPSIPIDANTLITPHALPSKPRKGPPCTAVASQLM